MAEHPAFPAIRNYVGNNDVVLFMKGTKDMPQCGFSAAAAQMLHLLGVEFKDVNVLADPEIRQGIKEFSDWPTVPQLYVRGEFIGGSDIMRAMYEQGELQALLAEMKAS
jgi:monothiol glutaredoxin